MAARHTGWFRSLSAPALSATLAGVLVLSATPGARAQAPEEPPQIEKSNYRIEGQLVTGAYLRSGPSDNYYLTQHLDKGAVVTVVGKKGNWLVVEPPEGCFSYVSKQYIDRYADGSKGRVKKPNQIVHAGSSIQPQSLWAVQTHLDVGQDVTILAEENQYFKIKPPPGAYLFIDREAVQPLPNKLADAGGANTGTPGAPGTLPGPATPPTPVPGTGAATPGTPEERPGTRPSGGRTPRNGTTDTGTAGGDHGGGVATGGAATGGTATAPAADPAAAPSTRPALTASLARLQKLESEFTAASSQPLSEQPIEALLAGYQDLAGSPGVPEATRKMADARAQTLKVRAQVRDEFVAVQQKQEEDRKTLEAGLAEQRELDESIKKMDVHVYVAVGTLRPSSLQVGNGAGHTTLYRLTDPNTGRGLIYVRTNDPKYADLIGQFVGVKGQVGTEAQLNLKVIAPTAVEPVDQSKVNNSVAAEIVPPSLLPKAPGTTPTASSGQ